MSETRYIGIADDHIMFRKGLIALINLFPGYEVTVDAGSGKELIDRLDTTKLPHIILMDINMPEMDGYVATEWLRDHHPAIKVLALSTMDTEAAIIKMIKSGAKGFVMKDADTEELKLAFNEVMSVGYFYNEVVTRKVMQAVSQLTDANNKTNTFINLSDRELDFLRYACTELTYKEIADRMNVGTRTVEGYRDALCEKLCIKTRVGLAMYAIKNGIAII